MPREQSRAKPGTGKGAGLTCSSLHCAEHVMARGNLCKVTVKRHISLNVLRYVWCKHLSSYVHFRKSLVLIVDTENEASSPRASACVLPPHAKFSAGFG